MCHPDSPWLCFCPRVRRVCQGFVPLSFSLFAPLPISFFLFRLSSFPSFSSLAAHTPCVLSRCTEDLTASLSSQQASELRDRCAKFKLEYQRNRHRRREPASFVVLAVTRVDDRHESLVFHKYVHTYAFVDRFFPV